MVSNSGRCQCGSGVRLAVGRVCRAGVMGERRDGFLPMTQVRPLHYLYCCALRAQYQTRCEHTRLACGNERVGSCNPRWGTSARTHDSPGRGSFMAKGLPAPVHATGFHVLMFGARLPRILTAVGCTHSQAVGSTLSTPHRPPPRTRPPPRRTRPGTAGTRRQGRSCKGAREEEKQHVSNDHWREGRMMGACK